jgi:hypothetical protein
MRYFEIYIPGRNGFSLYVKTDKQLSFVKVASDSWDTELEYEFANIIVDMAVSSKVLQVDDAEIFRYVAEFSEKDIIDKGVTISDIASI